MLATLYKFLFKPRPEDNTGFFPNLATHQQFLQKTIPKNTPIFVTDTKIIMDRISVFKQYFEPKKIDFQLAYSFKTNYDLAKYGFVLNEKILAEVVSENEFQLAKSLGFKNQNIIYNGPLKENFEKLVLRPIHLHLDNFNEIKKLQTISPKKIKAKIGLRVNTSSHPSRFGFNLESNEADKAVSKLIKMGIQIESLHIHLGSNIYQPQIYHTASQKIADYILLLKTKYNVNIKYLDFGGGYPAHGSLPYHSNLIKIPTMNSFLDAIVMPLTNKLDKLPILMFEPGRFLVDDSTVLISKVVNVKNINKQEITIDSTINMLSSAWYRPLITKVFDKNLKPKTGSCQNTVIYGSSCQEIDVLFTGKLPKISTDDFIVFYCVGAYNQSMSPDFIFNSPKTIFL